MNNNEGFSLARSLENGVDRLIGLIPEILGVLLLVIVGWILARVARKLTTAILEHVGFERAIDNSPGGAYVRRAFDQPSKFVGKVVYWIVFLAFVSFAISALGVPALTMMVNGIYAYLPNILAAIVIFLVASALTLAAEGFITRVLAPSTLSKLLAAVVPALIMPIAIFMILDQLKIAEDIVNITYMALVGSVALGLALAFGLGGRDVVAQILGQAYTKSLDQGDAIKREARQARGRTASAANQVRNRAR